MVVLPLSRIIWALVVASPGIALLQGSPCLIIWFARLTGIGNNQLGVELKYSVLPVIRVFEIDSAATLSSSMQATLAKMGREFDFSPRKVYGQQEFIKTVVKGPGELRKVVEAELARGGEAYLACLMGLTKDG